MSSALIIGNNVRKFRNKIGFTQMDMAEDMKISSCTLSRIETGKANTTINILDVIADYMGIPTVSLFDDSGNLIESDDLTNYDYEPGDSFVYYFVPEIITSPEYGKYLTYSIKCEVKKSDYSMKYIGMVHDVETDAKRISEFIVLINMNDLHPIHLYDVIDDWLQHYIPATPSASLQNSQDA